MLHVLCQYKQTFQLQFFFRFQSFCTAHSSFLDIVKNSWEKPTWKENSVANLNMKFKRLKYDLKHWSKSISKLKIFIENTNKALTELDNLEDKRRITNPEIIFRNILKKHLLRLLEYQKQYWKKSCTIRWIKFGDENAKFFQSIAIERYRRNNIAQLQLPDGT